jgi:ATP-dependent exoDNAse (exonuclease V) alpha subunit
VREWNGTELLKDWREAWEVHVNERLAALDIDARIDHRTLQAQGIELEPQHKIGPAGSRRLERGEDAERADDHLRIARENGAKIIADPGIALDAITRGQATFTVRDLAMFAHRHSDGKEQFDQVLGAVRSSPELVALGQDGKGQERFTSRDMIAAEQRLERAADTLADRAVHGVAERHVSRALELAEGRGLVLSAEQRGALERITDRDGLASVVGYAGSGKSAMLGWRARLGRRRATRCAVQRCRGSRRRIWKGDRASPRGRSPAWNISGGKAARLWGRAMCW